MEETAPFIWSFCTGTIPTTTEEKVSVATTFLAPQKTRSITCPGLAEKHLFHLVTSKKRSSWLQNNKLERHFHVFVVSGHKRFPHFTLRVDHKSRERQFAAIPTFLKVYGQERNTLQSTYTMLGNTCFLQVSKSLSIAPTVHAAFLPLDSITDG